MAAMASLCRLSTVLLLSLLPKGSLASTPCKEAIVGGGWGGVYFAYRRALLSEDPSSVCLFERSSRTGGRTYSVRSMNLTVDVECYEPDCPAAYDDFPKPFMFNYTAPLRRIVDPETRLPSGYVTAIEVLEARMRQLGVQIFMSTSLVDIHPMSQIGMVAGTAMLTFMNAADEKSTHTPNLVYLNLPRNRFFELKSLNDPAQTLISPRMSCMLKCVKFDRPAKLFPGESSILPTSTLSKAYLYYSDAWWHTKSNLTEGEYPANAFNPIHTSSGVYIGIHWNDGPIQCSTSIPKKCRGFLEVYYSVTNETFFSGISPGPDEPLGVASVDDGTELSKQRMEIAHEALVEAVKPILASHGLTPSDIPMPETIIVGAWNRPDPKHPYGQGFTAPTKVYWAPDMSGTLGDVCGVDGLTIEAYREEVLEPFGKGRRIFLGNNDYVAENVYYMWGDWAEETLLMAERALYRMGAPRPEWLNETYYNEKVEKVEINNQQ